MHTELIIRIATEDDLDLNDPRLRLVNGVAGLVTG
jgi:hypothetical protein